MQQLRKQFLHFSVAILLIFEAVGNGILLGGTEIGGYAAGVSLVINCIFKLWCVWPCRRFSKILLI